MALSGTTDARGYRQWKEVNRYVNKGAKAIYILVPRIVKRSIETDGGEEKEKEILTGFLAKPVFRVEDTKGDPLKYEQIELPELPLIERAQEWGISVKAVPGNYRYYGYFSQRKREIGLASKDETVFFHELAHAAQQKATGKSERKELWRNEIVAELVAATLCEMVGKTSKHLGNNYKYICHYAAEAHLGPVQACLLVIGDVENVLNLILQDGMGESVNKNQARGA
jgi:hypothetical protein